ncbi:MAG: uroporphyrinogen-III C-methyltransferase [Lachnospiraceae bacterium]|nr:uroporphyrinogen-III C-methyltransferase [Lachnospiraceae bacterium]
MGRVYLVGAGPGDAGLITRKGLEKLQSCDAVVYDRLISEELLDYVSEDCEKIYVGKEKGRHSKNQEEINRILIDCGHRYDMVVRLKGGDPFVFGRGGEEFEALCQAGITCEVIPGVTSAVAVPECAGIPVTHRGMARSFHVITGHTEEASGIPDYDYETLAKLEGTIVFLMGLSHLSELTGRLIAAGKSVVTPVAVISKGTMTGQQVVRGNLENIVQRVEEKGLRPPAVIVIGETAQLFMQAEQEIEEGASASGKRIGVVATDLLWKKLKNGFRKMGVCPQQICSMEVCPTAEMELLRRELQHLERYKWILFTSQNGVSLFFEEVKRNRIDFRSFTDIRFGVLGSGTADKLLEYGFHADFVPSDYKISTLAEEFPRILGQGESVLIPRAIQGSPVLIEALRRQQADFCELGIYDVTGHLIGNIDDLSSMDYLVFASASGVTEFFCEVEKVGFILSEKVKIVCIGEVTEQKLADLHGRADRIATVNNTEGILQAVRDMAGL